jgi:hypothetical protein
MNPFAIAYGWTRFADKRHRRRNHQNDQPIHTQCPPPLDDIFRAILLRYDEEFQLMLKDLHQPLDRDRLESIAQDRIEKLVLFIHGNVVIVAIILKKIPTKLFKFLSSYGTPKTYVCKECYNTHKIFIRKQSNVSKQRRKITVIDLQNV